jgi:hypothetical protein
VSRRRIATFTSPSVQGEAHTARCARVYRDTDWDEYRVVYFFRGEQQMEADSHHDTRPEAEAQARAFADGTIAGERLGVLSTAWAQQVGTPAQPADYLLPAVPAQVGTDWKALALQHARQRDEAMAQRDALQVRVDALTAALGRDVAREVAHAEFRKESHYMAQAAQVWVERCRALGAKPGTKQHDRERESYLQGVLAVATASGLMNHDRAAQIGFLVSVGRIEMVLKVPSTSAPKEPLHL